MSYDPNFFDCRQYIQFELIDSGTCYQIISVNIIYYYITNIIMYQEYNILYSKLNSHV